MEFCPCDLKLTFGTQPNVNVAEHFNLKLKNNAAQFMQKLQT